MKDKEFELILNARENEKSLETVLNTYKPLVTKIARRYFLVGGEMDDVVQEGMIGLYRAIVSYSPNKEAKFKTFATLCITRQIQTAIKKANSKKYKYFLDLYSMDNDETLSIAEPTNPEDDLISRENWNIVQMEIENKLTPLEKQILNEFLSGKSYEQIAENLNINKKSVDNGLNRIRTKLLHLIEGV